MACNGRRSRRKWGEWPPIAGTGTGITSSTRTSETTVSRFEDQRCSSDPLLICSLGHWTKEEEEQLTKIVTAMTVEQGRDMDSEVFWGKVSALMGGKRARQQCRIKWSVSFARLVVFWVSYLCRTDALSKLVKNEGEKPRWSQQDGYILVHKSDVFLSSGQFALIVFLPQD